VNVALDARSPEQELADFRFCFRFCLINPTRALNTLSLSPGFFFCPFASPSLVTCFAESFCQPQS